MQSVDDFYAWYPGSTLPADGVNVVTATAGPAGAWHRLYIDSLIWTQQPTWFIDPSNTSGLAANENTGLDAAHPLLTFRELRNRCGSSSYLANVVFNVMSSAPSPGKDPIVFDCNFIGTSMVQGVPTLGAAFSVGAVTVPVKTGPTAHGWWAAGVSGLTGLFIKVGGGVEFWADATQLGGTGTSTLISIPTGALNSDDMIQQATLPTVQWGSSEAPSFQGVINVASLSFTGSIFAGQALNATDCAFDQACDFAVLGTQLTNCAGIVPGNVLAASNTGVFEYTHGYFAGDGTLSTGTYVFTDFTSAELSIEIAGTNALYQGDLALGGPASTGGDLFAILSLWSDTALIANVSGGPSGTTMLYGSSTTVTHGLAMRTGSRLLYDPPNVPQLFGATDEFNVLGRTSTPLFDPTTFVAGASLACTWANVAAAQPAGFGGSVQVPSAEILLAPAS